MGLLLAWTESDISATPSVGLVILIGWLFGGAFGMVVSCILQVMGGTVQAGTEVVSFKEE